MAGILLKAHSGDVTLAASTAKTILQIKTGNNRAILRAWFLGGKQPAGGVDVPLAFRWTRNTASFGTGSSAALHLNDPQATDHTVLTTAFGNFTVEPTTPTDTGEDGVLQPQLYIGPIYLPIDRQIIIPANQSLQLECTSTMTPVVHAWVLIEE